MNWIDGNTVVLKDKSIVLFDDNGKVKLYPGSKWIKPRNKKDFSHYHEFNFSSRESAVAVFELIEKENSKLGN
jgi:hypothetical protein